MDCRPDASIVSHFKDLKDPRIERAKKHRLIDIIVIVLGSIMIGGDGFQDMELFGQSKRAWLEGFLDLSNDIPSHDTFGRVFSRPDPKQFHQCFLSWTQSVSELTQGMVVSLYGKTVRVSFDRPRSFHLSIWSRPGVRKMVDLSWANSRQRASPMKSRLFLNS
jgi:hypothetical protein